MTSTALQPEMISMDFSTGGRDNCYYRIRAGTHVKYVTVEPGALDAESLMDMPLQFESILPPLPYSDDSWTQALISRSTSTGELRATFSQERLPAVDSVWHPTLIDPMQLRKTERLTMLAEEAVWQCESHEPQTVIAKMARFSWEIQYMEAETSIFKHLAALQIGPRFLGHIHENGRVIGFALEKLLDRRPARPADLAACQAALGRLHAHGILHGDVNRYNFLVDGDGTATLIDFERAALGAGKDALDKEMASLARELSEESGRGGGFMDEESDTDEEDR